VQLIGHLFTNLSIPLIYLGKYGHGQKSLSTCIPLQLFPQHPAPSIHVKHLAKLASYHRANIKFPCKNYSLVYFNNFRIETADRNSRQVPSISPV